VCLRAIRLMYPCITQCSLELFRLKLLFLMASSRDLCVSRASLESFPQSERDSHQNSFSRRSWDYKHQSAASKRTVSSAAVKRGSSTAAVERGSSTAADKHQSVTAAVKRGSSTAANKRGSSTAANERGPSAAATVFHDNQAAAKKRETSAADEKRGQSTTEKSSTSESRGEKSSTNHQRESGSPTKSCEREISPAPTTHSNTAGTVQKENETADRGSSSKSQRSDISSSSSSSSSSDDSSSSNSSEPDTKNMTVVYIPDFSDEPAPKRQKLLLSPGTQSIVSREMAGNYEEIKSRRERYGKIPIPDCIFAYAPAVDDEFRLVLERHQKWPVRNDEHLKLLHQNILECSFPLVSVLNQLEKNACTLEYVQKALRHSLRHFSCVFQDITAERRFGVLRSLELSSHNLPEIYRSPISGETGFCRGTGLPIGPPALFGPDLSALLKERGRKDSSLAAAVSSLGGSSSFRRRPTVDFQRGGVSSFRYEDTEKLIFFECVPYHDEVGGRLSYFYKNWELITSDSWILDTISGYRLEFFEKPETQKIRPKPLKFSEDDSFVIDKEIKSLMDKKSISPFLPKQGEFFWSSRIFFVPKKSGELRPVINLRPLNSYLVYEHFKMENIAMVRDILKPNDFMAKIDLKDAYFAIPIYSADRKFLVFEWQNKLFCFNCLPFGLASAPRVFTKVLKPVISLLRQLGLRVIVYLDDLLLMNSTAEGLIDDVFVVTHVLTSLGFIINEAKSTLSPSQKLTYLGFEIDTIAMRFCLPDEKILAIASQCRVLAKANFVIARDLARLLGKITAASQAFLQAHLFIRHLQMCLAEAINSYGNYNAPLF